MVQTIVVLVPSPGIEPFTFFVQGESLVLSSCHYPYLISCTNLSITFQCVPSFRFAFEDLISVLWVILFFRALSYIMMCRNHVLTVWPWHSAITVPPPLFNKLTLTLLHYIPRISPLLQASLKYFIIKNKVYKV